jgi:hypothetical protein
MAAYDPTALVELLSHAVESSSVAQTIDQITTYAAQTFDTPHVGVTIIRHGGRTFDTVGPTSEVVRRADEMQNQLREGPCIEASTQSRTLVSNDVASDTRWRRWGPRTADLGLRSVLSSEIHAGGRRIGALNVYGDATRDFTRDDLETAQMFTSHAGAALLVSEKLVGLTMALDSRTLIGQAQGVLLHRYRVDADRAFAILKRYSQDENIRLVLVAQRIIDEVTAG